MPIERGGVKSVVGEYSISAGGPSERSLARWRQAHDLGLLAVATAVSGCTWELSAVPAIPALDLVAGHAIALRDAKVDGVSLSWTLGCYPSPNHLVFAETTKKSKSAGEVLDNVARSCYGAAAVPFVRKAWTAFSEGFREYPFHVGVVYDSPVQMGPANPLYATNTGWSASMVGIPYDDLKSWRTIYPAETWIAQMDKVADGFVRGCRLWQDAVHAMEGKAKADAIRDLGTYRVAELHFRSVADQARFVLARDRGDRAEMRRIAARELATAKEILPLVRADSRIGYECSNHYFYIPQDIVEKIVLCRGLAR